jgi:hypothetical protein
MDRIKVRSITARMVSEMMARVIALNNATANSDDFYVFEFTGCVNAVHFAKYRETPDGLEDVIYRHAYLDRDDLGHPLAEIEQLIANEELMQREAKK